MKKFVEEFLSTGNQYSEIDFQGSPTTLIVGANGSGKSTVLDALTFGLFAKPFRKINRSQLINTVNEKDLCVEVEFKIGTISWKVIRGVKPIYLRYGETISYLTKPHQ